MNGIKPCDGAIVGGGILGVSLAYWFSKLKKETSVALIEKENDLALHASGRNTGVVHRPFYINPAEKPTFAKCAQESFFFWKDFAVKHHLPWSQIGTLAVAVSENQ